MARIKETRQTLSGIPRLARGRLFERTRSREAMLWYRENIMSVNRQSLLNDDEIRKRSKPSPGKMYMFRYDPKHKETLPFYDRFPIIFMVDSAKGGFYGLNLHYLPPKARIIFFERLLMYSTHAADEAIRMGVGSVNPSKWRPDTEKERLVLSYNLLKGASRVKAFEHCFKHYLFDHLRSHLAEVPTSKWGIAIAIPSEQFVKADKNLIWRGKGQR